LRMSSIAIVAGSGNNGSLFAINTTGETR
jgi:hypothetical protein